MIAHRSLFRIVVLEGSAKDRRYYVREAGADVGRDPACRIAIDDEALADRHLTLMHDTDGVRVDLHDDVADVHRNGQIVESGTVLRHGDVLEIGDLRLQFERVEPLPHYDGRRKPPMQVVAAAGVFLIAAIQALVLLGLWVTPPDLVSRETVEAVPAGETVPEPGDEPIVADAALGESVEVETTSPPMPDTEDELAATEPIVLETVQPAASADSEASATTSELSDATASTDPVTEEEDAWTTILFEARRAIADNRLDDADALLAEAESMSPEMSAPFVTRARLFERRGLIEEAIAHWDEVINRVAGTEYAAEATAEQMRLVRMMQRRETPVEVPAPEPESAPPDVDVSLAAVRVEDPIPEPPIPDEPEPTVGIVEPPPAEIVTETLAPPLRIQIVETRREKFQNRENYEEIRMVRVVLAPRESAGELKADAVEVHVRFFDRVPDTGEILISDVPAPTKGLIVEGDWAAQEQKLLSALYMVPSGFRENEQRQTGRRRQFYGYVVQVLYDGAMQDEASFPASLLVRSRRLL